MNTAPRPTRIMSALILRAMVDETILPEFDVGEQRAEMIWAPTMGLMQRVRDGERADAILAIDWAIDELVASGLVDPATRRPLVQAAFGIAVMAGAPKPDISSTERLRQTLLDAPTLVYSRTGASGIYFEKLIDQLGIGERIREKAIVIHAGLTAEKVVSGEATLAVQQISELLAVPGAELVGPFPRDVQETTDFSTALFTDAKDVAGARRFIDLLYTSRAQQTYRTIGLRPFF
jgi:molybdate transport system substrate-binding protein